MKSNPPFEVAVARVESLRIPERLPRGIAAFAIDGPRAGDESDGAGFEINGWVIGEAAPVQAVRTVSNGHLGRLHPLDVRRPDVATDYPTFGHAASSGFSVWAAIEDGSDDFQVAVEAVLANGTTVMLAEISGNALITKRGGWSLDALPVTAPDFVIIGAQRGGTTSLHAYLSAHPQVRTPATKELHFFTDRHGRGLDWYLGQFRFGLPLESITGEATPYALFHPLAPERLRRVAPRAKLIALLRNPVDRAYSHYLLERSRGVETLEFSAAIEAEADRLTGEEAMLRHDPTYVSEPHKHASYRARGDYAPQLERWFAHFPREQMLVPRSEDLYQQPAETFAQVAAFLGIAPEVNVPFAVHNRLDGPPLPPEPRARLAEYFAPKNAALAKLLGWDRGWE